MGIRATDLRVSDHENLVKATREVVTLLNENNLLVDPRAKALIRCYEDERNYNQSFIQMRAKVEERASA